MKVCNGWHRRRPYPIAFFHCPLDLQNASNGSKTLRKVMVQNCSMKVSFIVMWECSAIMFYKEKKQHLRCKVQGLL